MNSKIILSFTYCNHLGQSTDYNQEFYSVQHFKQHLRWVPDKGMMLGLFKADPETLRLSHSSNVKVSIVAGTQAFNFDNIRDLDQFLVENASIAKSLMGG